ncbi:MAG TPA: aminotransferase class I/II-fold pyridoxal phosphate-dependent enzyme, partial [Nitrospirota bacterium]
MGKMDFIDEELARLRTGGLYNTVHVIGSEQGAWIDVDGSRALNLCSNNYLGLAGNPRVKEAARGALSRFGAGPAAVRSIAGTLTLHKELERKLAAFKGVEATLSFQSGFMANLAVIPAFVGEGDEIFSDELNHASIIDGSRLTHAAKTRYKHADMDDLRAKLAGSAANRKLVVTDGVFSMDGDIAPLDKVVDISEGFDAIVMVDDAHGEGVLGRGGRGIVDHFGLHGRVELEIGTMSKAFGVVGGYVAGSSKVVDYLVQKARPFLFSSAMTAADTAACIASVDLMSESGELVERLWKNAEYFQGRMRLAGFDLGVTRTPITPVMIGDVDAARRMSALLLADGVFAQAIGFPTVPVG